MRKTLCILLCTALCIGFCACGKTGSKDPDPVVDPPVAATLERVESKLNYKYFDPNFFDPQGCSDIMVVLVSFTDGYDVPHVPFEKLFNWEFGENTYIQSVSSYYRFNSYGKATFDFHFFYYDSPMTSQEAYDYVYEEWAPGHIYGNTYLYEIFDELKKDHSDEIAALDKDQDGYIDCCLFVFADKLSENTVLFGGAEGVTAYWQDEALVGDPTFRNYIKLPYVDLDNTDEAVQGGIRTLHHEIGHLFGIPDYYDSHDYNGTYLNSLGYFDLHEGEFGDINVFSKFMCGWLNPYYVTPETDSVTVTIKNSSLNNDAILIPTSMGWNGTAFDEYILVDVLAKKGANGFDWNVLKNGGDPDYATVTGGVRVYHVDARMISYEKNYTDCRSVDDVTNLPADAYGYTFRFVNTNGFDPYVKGDSRFFHLVELIPKNGSAKFRLKDPADTSHIVFFKTADLFKEGDTFSMSDCADAFPNAPYMNNGGTLDYSFHVDSYDPTTTEATITITRIR